MKFEQIIGQEETKEKLIHSYREGRLAHAILLLGSEGSGNLALALAFAQYLSCSNKSEMDSCGLCPSCKKHASLQHPDLHFSFPYFNKTAREGSGGEKTTSHDYSGEWRECILANPYMGIEHWRSVITKDNKVFMMGVAEAEHIVKRLSLKSYEGGRKFMIVWLPEYIRQDAANKLLKTLEEPPEGTLFIFVSNSVERLLSTVLSRVQVLHVPKIPDDVIHRELISRGVDETAAAGITHYVDGNWWRAELLSSSKDPNEFFSTQFIGWMRNCYTKNIAEIVRWADEMHKLSRDDQKEFLMYALDQIRQNLVLNYAGMDLARMNAQEAEFSKKFSVFINEKNAENLMDLISEAHKDISGMCYSKLVLSDLSFKVHYELKK
ncbi:MAG: ATP-binding protein [Flavobacteriales bacterium]